MAGARVPLFLNSSSECLLVPRREIRLRGGRDEIATRAARLLVEGAPDFETARRKALHGELARAVGEGPDNLSIFIELARYLNLFHYAPQLEHITLLRTRALRVLQRLARFSATLCGPTWYGTALRGNSINLHVHLDEVEVLSRYFIEHGVNYQLGEAIFKFSAKLTRAVPVFLIEAESSTCEIALFQARGNLSHPLSSIDNRPVKRATLQALADLIESRALFPPEVERLLRACLP